MSDTLYISPRFQKAIVLHIIKNQLGGNHRAPLLLGIHGKPGDGKTFQCEKVLERLGVKSFLISGGELESADAGKPAELIRNTYLDAGFSIDKGETKLAAVLINDIDTGLGDWGDMVQYTINRQTAYGELMHLVDYPTQVENTQTRRIPIIITGNDFSKLYEPLVRAGRMTAFLWNPNLQEKAQMVHNIFPSLDNDECEQLIVELESYAEQELAIAFFAHLKSHLQDEVIWSQIKGFGVDQLVQFIPLIQNNPNLIPSLNDNIGLDVLIQHGQYLIESGQLLNHLKG